jgi:hypothetical protein
VFSLLLGAAACAGDELAPSVGYRNETARAVCAAVFDQVDLGIATACVSAIAADCEAAVGVLSDPFLAAVHACIEAGGDPLVCMGEASLDLEAGPAQRDLAAAFCDRCAFDLPECEQAFYVGQSSQGIGTLFLPLSDEVVHDIRDSCTTGLFCAADFWSCVADRLVARFNSDEAAWCLLFDALS